MLEEPKNILNVDINLHSKIQVSNDTPVMVMIAGIALIAIRFLDIVLMFNTLDINGIYNFINNSNFNWDLIGLILLGLAMVFIEISCGFGVIRAANWARWCYLSCQIISIVIYLILAIWRGFYPEIFMLSGDTIGQISYQVLMVKLPNLIVITLLFCAPSSRNFFTSCKID